MKLSSCCGVGASVPSLWNMNACRRCCPARTCKRCSQRRGAVLRRVAAACTVLCADMMPHAPACAEGPARAGADHIEDEERGGAFGSADHRQIHPLERLLQHTPLQHASHAVATCDIITTRTVATREPSAGPPARAGCRRGRARALQRGGARCDVPPTWRASRNSESAATKTN
jgi:hypothetical protein